MVVSAIHVVLNTLCVNVNFLIQSFCSLHSLLKCYDPKSFKPQTSIYLLFTIHNFSILTVLKVTNEMVQSSYITVTVQISEITCDY